MKHKGEWRPVTAAAYDEEVATTCQEIERLRAAVWARFAALGATAAAPRLAAELRELRATILALRSGPPIDDR